MTETVSAALVPPRILTIAGSDSGGGAGIQADLKTIESLGGFGMSAVTAITAQNTMGVRSVQLVRPDIVSAQIDACFEDLGVDAVKVGMLGSAEIVTAVADSLRRYRPQVIVVDPVMVSTAGSRLLAEAAEEVLRSELVPQATLVTPNAAEAAILFRAEGDDRRSDRELVRLAKKLGRTGALEAPFLLTGGDRAGSTLVDVLIDGDQFLEFAHPRIETTSTHGTGCTLSSAIAVHLAAGIGLVGAIGASIDYVEGALERACEALGSGPGPLRHGRDSFGNLEHSKNWETRSR